MLAILIFGRPVALGAPELLAILVILLVFFSAPLRPEGQMTALGSRLTRGERRFLICLGVVLAVLVGLLVAPGRVR